MYNIDYYRFLLQLLPMLLRKPVMVAYMQVLIIPVVKLYNTFTEYREQTLYELAHNGQVYSMENVLNDRFDMVTRRIYITDGFAVERFYIYTRDEAKPQELPQYLYNPADYADTGVDFIVWVPKAVVVSDDEMVEMNALIKFYKLASKRYKIYRK